MNEEQWRVIPDFPAYSVSDHGRVRRDVGGGGAVPGRILKYNLMTSGYHCVQLWRDSKPHPRSIHRLVASVFLPPPEDGQTEVAHFDGDRLNNHVSNLRWADRKANMADTKRHGTNPAGSRNAMAKLTELDVEKIKTLIRSGENDNEIAAFYGVHKNTIGLIRIGRTWKHVA
jgi:hypothetical protein